MVITEPAIPSAQLLGLGSKQYSNNIQRMFNKDFTRSVMQIVFKSARSSMQVKESLCWYPGTSHRNAGRAYFYYIVNMVTENRQRRATFSYIEV